MLKKSLKTKIIDIGVSIPKMDSSFMDNIMCSNISDSYSNDIWLEDNLKSNKITEKEFESFLDEVGIGAKNFKDW